VLLPAAGSVAATGRRHCLAELRSTGFGAASDQPGIFSGNSNGAAMGGEVVMLQRKGVVMRVLS
jgi:hypothetical protein